MATRKALHIYGEPFLFVSNSKILYLYPTMYAEVREYVCAYCGEVNETLVDPSAGAEQSYAEDCAVCCRPNVLSIRVGPSTGTIVIEAVIEE